MAYSMELERISLSLILGGREGIWDLSAGYVLSITFANLSTRVETFCNADDDEKCSLMRSSYKLAFISAVRWLGLICWDIN